MDPLSVTLASAYALDLSLGDPRWLPHPVRGLGWMIERGERFLRRVVRQEVWAGAWLVIGVVLATWVIVQGLLSGAGRLFSWGPQVMEGLLLYACLSTKDLAVESWPIFRALKAGDLPQAREKLSWIVGRDTHALDEPEVVRATLETIAESVMDGIVAPLFYAAIGGAPLACVYKAVNTLDSMVGYRSSRYIRFGKVAARLDAWMNVIPARLTAGLIALSAGMVGFSVRNGMSAARRDAWHRGENSWIPEAALAGALEVQLGGASSYQGKRWETPPLGRGGRPLRRERIPEAIRLMYACSFLTLGAVLLARWGILQLWGWG